jgi:metal-responsive CopG/Arc/MetJ family transcriptional regulator
MRTIIDLPDEQIEALKVIGEINKKSRAELVRQAVAAYIQQHNTVEPADAFGILKDAEIDDPVLYQQKLRDEWA